MEMELCSWNWTEETQNDTTEALELENTGCAPQLHYFSALSLVTGYTKSQTLNKTYFMGLLWTLP